MFNINEMSIRILKKVNEFFNFEKKRIQEEYEKDHMMIGKYVIIRTYSAGVHAGVLYKKAGNEVILKESRRLYYWMTKNKGISLSEVAISGIEPISKICSTLDLLWLQAIEIIPCTSEAQKSIREAKEYRA